MPHRVYPYRAAATLAITLMREHPTLTEAGAIEIAWQCYSSLYPDVFRVVLYNETVQEAMSRILVGNEELVDPPPPVLRKAREILG
jgi:hypothetical protein